MRIQTSWFKQILSMLVSKITLLIKLITAQLTFTLSKSTIETLEKVNDVVLVFLLLTWNIFHTFFYCFCCYFEQVGVGWVIMLFVKNKSNFIELWNEKEANQSSKNFITSAELWQTSVKNNFRLAFRSYELTKFLFPIVCFTSNHLLSWLLKVVNQAV